MTVRKIIIDTDPGIDDAVAILLALASPELEVLGLTIEAGNVGLEQTTRNALQICDLADRADLPVFAGCPKPLLRPQETAERVHGATGLGGVDLPPPSRNPTPGYGADFIVDRIMSADDNKITLCTLGPLTTVAIALAKEPRIAGKIREIVIMGGAFFKGGNSTPTAEFNILCDPHAAAMVFACRAPKVLMSLDLTHQVLSTDERIAAFAAVDTPVMQTVAKWLDFYGRHDIERYGGPGGPLHDPTVIGYLLRPDLFSGKDVFVEVETRSPVTEGMTIFDWWGMTGRQANTKVMQNADIDGFYALLVERLSRYAA